MCNHAGNLDDHAELIGAARGGNTEAFGKLVGQYYSSVYCAARKITKNHEDAEDAIQDATLKAFTNLSKFRGDSLFYTWYMRIVVNQALMKLRSTRTRKEVTLSEMLAAHREFTLEWKASDWRQNPETYYRKLELQQILFNSFEGLRPALGKVFLLRNVWECSTLEVAEILGLSVAAVKSRLLRARLILRHQLIKTLKPGLNSAESATIPQT